MIFAFEVYVYLARETGDDDIDAARFANQARRSEGWANSPGSGGLTAGH